MNALFMRLSVHRHTSIKGKGRLIIQKDMMMSVEALFSLFLFLVFPITYFFLKHKFSKKLKTNQPPSPPSLPLLGNLHQIGRLPHRSLTQLANKHGPVMTLRFGSMSAVIVSSAEPAMTVLKTHDLDTCSRPAFQGTRKLTYDYQDLAFCPYGEYWREMRKICVHELLSVKRVQSYWSVREEELVRMISSVSDHASSGNSIPFDLTQAVFSLTAGITFGIAFGTSFQESDLNCHEFHEVVQEVATFLGTFVAADCFPYVGWIADWLSGSQKRSEAIFRKIDNLLQGVIDDHRSPSRAKPENCDIVDLFFKIMNVQTGFGATLTERNIKAVLLNIFLGGVDSGAGTIIWAMTELAKRPNLMKKAQDEVRSCCGNKMKGTIINETDIDRLQYLKMIVKETLRLHPPATIVAMRETISHFKLEGYDIYPKTLILVNGWAIGRDPKYWKVPEEFIPERFMDSPVEFKGQHFELLPFGSGRRMCPGLYMGASTVELSLANLLFEFDWKLPDGMKEEDINMDETVGFTLITCKRTNLELVPTKHH